MVSGGAALVSGSLIAGTALVISPALQLLFGKNKYYLFIDIVNETL